MNDNNSLELVQAILDGINKTIKIIVRKELEARIAELNIKPFMTIEEAAEYLGISVNTLYQYNSKKVIPHQKVGKNTYYLLED